MVRFFVRAVGYHTVPGECIVLVGNHETVSVNFVSPLAPKAPNASLNTLYFIHVAQVGFWDVRRGYRLAPPGKENQEWHRHLTLAGVNPGFEFEFKLVVCTEDDETAATRNLRRWELDYCGNRSLIITHSDLQCELLLRFDDPKFFPSPYLPLESLPRSSTQVLLLSLAQNCAGSTPLPSESVCERVCKVVIPYITKDGSYHRAGINMTYALDFGLPPGRSAVQVASTGENSRATVAETLSSAYHARTKYVFQRLALPPGFACDDKGQIAYTNGLGRPSHSEFFEVLQTVARNIYKRLPEINLENVDQLMQRVARIVRGRLECNLVSRQNNFMNSDHHRVWVRHCEAAAGWFAILFALIHEREILSERKVTSEIFWQIVHNQQN